MAKVKNDSISVEGVRKQILRAVVTAILALFVWLTFTVHQLSIDVAVMKNQLILIPKMVSGISKNRCPFCAGITVRNQQESVSVLSKNHCPEWPGITVRFGQEYAIV